MSKRRSFLVNIGLSPASGYGSGADPSASRRHAVKGTCGELVLVSGWRIAGEDAVFELIISRQ